MPAASVHAGASGLHVHDFIAALPYAELQQNEKREPAEFKRQ